MKPFFSIIIPTLNEEKYLPILLNCLAKQTIKDFEIIIVDGRSEDKTLSKITKFKKKLPNVTVLESSTRNVSYQRNLGAKIAKGSYLIFFDADNQISENFLHELKLKLEKQKVDVFTTWCVPDSNKKRDKAITTLINIMIETAETLDTGTALGAMIGCKSKYFQKIHGFDIKIKFAEDGDFVRRVIKAGGNFKVFRTPIFIWSFRRFKKEGTLKVLRKYALLHLREITSIGTVTEKDYPMGGHLYNNNKSTKLITQINKTMQRIIKNPKTLKKIRKTLKKLEVLN